MIVYCDRYACLAALQLRQGCVRGR